MNKKEVNLAQKIIVFTVLFVFLLLFSLRYSLGACTGTSAPSTGSWVVNDTTSCSNQVTVLNGNLTIQTNGNLTFSNVTLIMNQTNQSQIIVQSGSVFEVVNSNITARSQGCKGTARACSSFSTDSTCNAQNGCTWDGLECTGTVSTCASITSLATCRTQKDCYYDFFVLLARNSSNFTLTNSYYSRSGANNTGDQRGLEINSTLNNFTGNHFYDNYIGLTLYSDNNTIKDISINRSFLQGFRAQGIVNNTFINITITNSLNIGFYILETDDASKYSFNNTIYNLTVINATGTSIAGYYLQQANNTVLVGANIINSTEGIHIVNSAQRDNFNFVQDSNISGSSSADIIMTTGANFNNTLELLNTTFKKSNVSFSAGTKEKLIVKWYLDVTVNLSNSSYGNNANVTAFNTSNNLIFTGQTNSNGATTRQNITEYIQNVTGKFSWNNYTISANNTFGFNNNSLIINITGYTLLNITLNDTTNPTWTNITKNLTTIYNDSLINFSVVFSDTAGLAGYIFSINQTGNFTNSSYVSFSGDNSTAANVTRIIVSAGTNVSWYFVANDTSGNLNQTTTQTFIISANPSSVTSSSGSSDSSSGRGIPKIQNASSEKIDLPKLPEETIDGPKTTALYDYRPFRSETNKYLIYFINAMIVVFTLTLLTVVSLMAKKRISSLKMKRNISKLKRKLKNDK